jgi:uncharacterized protein (TIGR03083 family)
MSKPAYAEFVAAVRREGEATVAAGRGEADLPIPSCPRWRMSDLLLHVAGAFGRATRAVAQRATTAPEPPERPADDTMPVDHLSAALDELVVTLSDAGPDSPAWNWTGDNQVAHFWARRMAHESAVHRYDAQRARGVAQPVDADLARDGLDEMLDVILPLIVAHRQPTLPRGSFVFEETDAGNTWSVDVADTTVQRVDVIKTPDVTARGTASGLLLAVSNRVPWSSLEVSGDTALLDRWSEAFRF